MLKTTCTRHFFVIVLLMTVMGASGIFLLIRDPWSRIGPAVDPLTSTLHDREVFESSVEHAVQRFNSNDSSLMYVQATLALHALDYPMALMLFERLHQLTPEGTEYYLGYAQALLHTRPDDPILKSLIELLQRESEPDLQRWLLFAQFEQVHGRYDTALAYYEKARALAVPGSVLESAIRAQEQLIKY